MDKIGGTLPTMAQRALSEIGAVFSLVTDDVSGRMCAEILAARRIACYGVGREGLMMKALCMRLMHLGLDAHSVGDMTAPPIGKGDLLLVSAGPGSFSTVLALLGIARQAGARTMVVTAQPAGAAPRSADVVIHLPAQTMADDRADLGRAAAHGKPVRSRPAHLLRSGLHSSARKMGQSPEDMRARHTNLE